MAGYAEQLERVQRYYNRFKNINDGREHTMSTDHYVDDVHAFFMACYHLKDWLKNDSSYAAHTKQEIEDYVSKTPALAICADICNGLKHLVLDPKFGPPRSGDEPTIGGKHIELTLTASLSGPKIPPRISMKFEIQHSGKTLDAFQLATDALAAWQSFI